MRSAIFCVAAVACLASAAGTAFAADGPPPSGNASVYAPVPLPPPEAGTTFRGTTIAGTTTGGMTLRGSHLN